MREGESLAQRGTKCSEFVKTSQWCKHAGIKTCGGKYNSHGASRQDALNHSWSFPVRVEVGKCTHT